MAAAAPAAPPPRTTPSNSGGRGCWFKEAFIFDILHFVLNRLCHDKTELGPVVDHVPLIGRPVSMEILTAPHLIRTLAGPPVCATQSICGLFVAIAIVEIGLPRYSHCCGQCAGVFSGVDAERTFLVISRLIKDEPANLDSGKERAADTRFQRGAIERLRPIFVWQLVEWRRRRLSPGPIGIELSLRPEFH